jgi:acyl-CoA-binding protein
MRILEVAKAVPLHHETARGQLSTAMSSMVGPSVTFDQAVQAMGTTSVDVSDEEKLELYSWYKQATAADCQTDEPPGLSQKAKWKAWMERRGTKPAEARRKYIELSCLIDPTVPERVAASTALSAP